MRRLHSTRLSQGFSYVELLFVVVISGMVSLALMGLLDTAADSSDTVATRNDLNREGRFAMQQMVQAVSHTRRLLLPLADSPYTNWPENIREQTVPASAPLGDSTLATAVLAVTQREDADLDHNGKPDVDNDNDGRIDEDPNPDNTNDNAPGIVLIDDNGDGVVDVSAAAEPNLDNDEGSIASDDPANGVDDDGDGSVDEDIPADSSLDGQPGLAGVDDDGDGSIDEGSVEDDDEDGTSGEDSFDPVVFYLSGDSLLHRIPVPWDENGDTAIDGRDYKETPIAENVTRFRVEKVADTGRGELVDLTLELTDPVSGESVSLHTSVRVGGSL